MGKSFSKHLKRLPSPPHWPIHPKEATWTFKPSPGPHPSGSCIPLGIALRDMLKLARNGREAKMIVSEGRVRVDGKTRRDVKYPMGLMDLVEIPDIESHFRVLPITGKGLRLLEAPSQEASVKPCKIVGKTTTKRGVQLNLHDGRNLTFPRENPPVEGQYRVGDTVLIDLSSGGVKGHVRFSKGAYVLVTSGRNMGKTGRLLKVVEGTATRPAQAIIEGPEGKVFQTIVDYVFAIGEEKPLITIGPAGKEVEPG